LVVVVAEVTEQAEWSYERGTFGATAYEFERLADWFQQRGVQEVVMESTAQYWRPVWGALEQYWTRKQAGCKQSNTKTKRSGGHLWPPLS
jgi:hypothetical protein